MWIDVRRIGLGGQFITHDLIRDVLEPHGLPMHMICREIRVLPEPCFPQPVGPDQLTCPAMPFYSQYPSITLDRNQSVSSNLTHRQPGDPSICIREGNEDLPDLPGCHLLLTFR